MKGRKFQSLEIQPGSNKYHPRLRGKSAEWQQMESVEPELFPQRVRHNDIVGHRPAANEMLLNNSFQDHRGAGVIPDAVGVNHGDGSALANAQAVGFSPINAAVTG